ncbi:MAG: mitochondral 37S ribosomal protein S27 [Vezdaea aestivalis]|nr:MAG: mitochondral 37S ribosomal protein S27 [Vezdaea aestivalis]
MAVSKERLLDLLKAQCRIFSTTFNPERVRTGNKILRARLRGPSAVEYYPPRVATFKDLVATFRPFGLVTWDDKEEDRLDSLER